MNPRPHRVLTAALLAFPGLLGRRVLLSMLGLLVLAPAAGADEWVIVVDADEVDASAPETLPDGAKALLAALEKRKLEARAVAARHPLLALKTLLGQADEDEAQIVVFVGAFDQQPEATEAALEKARAAWAEAPAGSRLLPLEGVTAGARDALADLAGLADGGAIVLGFDAPSVETDPFSPLDADSELIARVRVPATLLRVAADEAGAIGDVLQLEPARESDSVQPKAGTNAALLFEVRRPVSGPRAATCTFRETGDVRAFVLAEPPDAVSWTWADLRADARLRAIDGAEARPVDATDTEVGGPRELRYRIEATKPAAGKLTAVVHVDDAPRPVPGLRVWIEGKAARDTEIVEAVLRVRYAPKPASPQDVEGEIRIGGNVLPFHVSADAGRAKLAATPPGRPFALPLARDRSSVTVQVRATNGNMPETAAFELTCEPEAYAERVRLRVFRTDGAEQRVAPGAAFALPTGEAVEVIAELNDLDAWAPLEPGRLRIRPAKQDGVVMEGALELPYRFRNARLVVQDEQPQYRLTDDALEAVVPLRLTLDADGGDGAWLLSRLSQAPRVTERGSETLSDWVVVEEGRGTWRVEATGAWRGIKPAPFQEDRAGVTFAIAWDGGAVPGDVQAAVDVPARWGTRGWVFVGLAVLAIALATITFLQLRSPPVKGTLLYAVEGLERTVGRLDLAPVGRRASVISSDERGRLDVGTEGTPVATIRPTRVGAMLEAPGSDGEPERRLLVDGLSLRTGRHTLRYVSGDADEVEAAVPLLEVPDLLGPEFDLESGAVDALPESTS